MDSQLAKKLAGARQLLDPILGEDKQRPRVPLGHEDADAVLRGGIAPGMLHEILSGDMSAAAAGFAMGIAARLRGTKRVLWIRQDYSALEHAEISATGLSELGLDPFKVLLLRAADAKDALCAATDAMSCIALSSVIIEVPGNPKILDLVASRRLALAAQHRGVTAILLRPGAKAEPGAAETRWTIRTTPSADIDDWGYPRFDAELSRNRHGETGRWVVEWSCDDGVFRKPQDGEAQNPRPVASASADGPAETAWRHAG